MREPRRPPWKDWLEAVASSGWPGFSALICLERLTPSRALDRAPGSDSCARTYAITYGRRLVPVARQRDLLKFNFCNLRWQRAPTSSVRSTTA